MSEVRANLIPDMAAIINVMYPVGRTIICDHNPETDYPWQTWEQSFKDRFPIGAGSTYAAGATGGSSTINLAHSHTVNSHTHTVDVNYTHAHTYNIKYGEYYGVISGDIGVYDFVANSWNGESDNTYTETNKVNNAAATAGTSRSIDTHNRKARTTVPENVSGNTKTTSGSAPGTNSKLSSAQSIMPPYEGAYFWTRTA